MSVMESINVKIDNYLPLKDHSKSEDPSSSSSFEEGDTITDPKEDPTLDDEIAAQSQRRSKLHLDRALNHINHLDDRRNTPTS